MPPNTCRVSSQFFLLFRRLLLAEGMDNRRIFPSLGVGIVSAILYPLGALQFHAAPAMFNGRKTSRSQNTDIFPETGVSFCAKDVINFSS